jgi:hypothetical protein
MLDITLIDIEAAEPLASLLANVKVDAQAEGLTDAGVYVELAAYNA